MQEYVRTLNVSVQHVSRVHTPQGQADLRKIGQNLGLREGLLSLSSSVNLLLQVANNRVL